VTLEGVAQGIVSTADEAYEKKVPSTASTRPGEALQRSMSDARRRQIVMAVL
jgi:hypothetical protein